MAKAATFLVLLFGGFVTASSFGFVQNHNSGVHLQPNHDLHLVKTCQPDQYTGDNLSNPSGIPGRQNDGTAIGRPTDVVIHASAIQIIDNQPEVLEVLLLRLSQEDNHTFNAHIDRTHFLKILFRATIAPNAP